MRVLRLLSLLLVIGAIVQLWFLWLVPSDLSGSIKYQQTRAPRWMATTTQLKHFASMAPFSSAERAWLQTAERRIRACRDSLLHFDIDVPEACVSEITFGKLNQNRGPKKNIFLSALLTFRNSADMTSLALTASVLALASISYESEIILVDDSSTEKTTVIQRVRQRLSEFSGINIRLYITQDGPIGYGMANNLALSHADGNYILLLNNDVLIFQYTIFNLLATFESRDNVGAVVPRFVGIDGKLQEAGGVIFKDGRAMHLGASLGLKNDPIFRYVRPIDYGSAACLLIRRDLIRNGFDAIYRPAYYEDTDLSMSVRRSGFNVLYQPFSVALHRGSMTYNNESIKNDLMAKNQDLFVRKWSEALQCHYNRFLTNWNNGPSKRRILQLASRLSIFRIIFLDWNVPCFDRDSGSVRTINLIRVLQSLGAHLTFVAIDVKYDDPCVYHLNWLGVHVIKHSEFDLGWEEEVRMPCDYDIIFVSRRTSFAMWNSLLNIACPGTPLVFDTVDLHFLRELRELMASEGVNYKHDMNLSHNIIRYKSRVQTLLDDNRKSSTVKTQALRYWKWLARLSEEVSFMNRSTATIVVSPIELEIIRELKELGRLRPTLPIFHVSNIHDDETLAELNMVEPNFQQRKGCLFVGNWAHTPNVDAVQFLIYEILPHLANNSDTPSEFALHVVGAGEPPSWMHDVHDVGGIPVVMHGFVKDLGTILKHVRVAVAPLRYGAGVKGKVNSAMIHGVPVVATSMAIEGMFLNPNEDVVVADNATSFATRLLELYLNYDLWTEIRTAAFLNVRKHFSTSAAKRGIHKLLDFLYEVDPHLKSVVADGTHALEGTDGCERMRGRYGLGAVVPNTRLVVSSTSDEAQFDEVTTMPRNFVFDSDSTYLDSIWGLSSVDDARIRCETDIACTGFCFNPEDWTFFYFRAISEEKLQQRGSIGDYPPGWTCWLNRNRIKKAPHTVPDDGYSDVGFDIVSSLAHRIFKPKPTTRVELRLVTLEDARRRCVLFHECATFCHNPGDWTFFYDDTPSNYLMIDRDSISSDTPGWTCFRRKIFDNTNTDKTAIVKFEFSKALRPNNHIYGDSYMAEALKLNKYQTQVMCANDRRCTAYCHHPKDFAWTYEMRPGKKLNRHQTPHGWNCYTRPTLLASVRKGGGEKQLTYAELLDEEKKQNNGEHRIK